MNRVILILMAHLTGMGLLPTAGQRTGAGLMLAGKDTSTGTLKISSSRLVFLATSPGKGPISYTVRLLTSQVVWYCKEGNQPHSGSIRFSSGQLILEDGQVKSGQLVLDLASLRDNDLTDPSQNKLLVDRIKSPLFLNGTSFPKAVIQILSASPRPDGRTELTGTLTLRGIQKSFSFSALIKLEKNLLQIETEKSLVEGVQFGILPDSSTQESKGIHDFMIKLAPVVAVHL